MTYQPMKDLPRNARFYGVTSERIEYVVTCPASEHPDGWVEVIRVRGGGSGFFSAGQVEHEVEVIES